ncbi:sulfite exporter TauE/SafE family protein [Motiliproteus coralliicola]|uniref:Sulfite exporter TauE/SafE family protein n=1 Tax=Motiliproteus coralliicola TaxID=2283196 RepID=A0A369WXS0_9GAMM|nr:sulfite exporter TauE/SafE family protein [Motiliproteus coralliicola]RDE24305.1 sulfite exporter TauE/SafE family protein [Motiliproteus coralliicola]
METLSYLSAFMVGLLGGVHCLGMCGGITGTLNLGLEPKQRENAATLLLFQLSYNLGRIFSYTLAGALMGGLGILLVQWLPLQTAQRVLLGFAGIFMMLLGLYLGGWWMLLNRVEQLGRGLWVQIEPLGRRLLPVKTPSQALLLGTLWGWLPCGLVYSMLINATASGGLINGALLMLAFALGTLPNLLLMGVLTGAAAHLLQSKRVKQLSGLLVLGFGVWTLYRALLLG